MWTKLGSVQKGYTNYYYYQENTGLYLIDGGKDSPYEVIFSKDGILDNLISYFNYGEMSKIILNVDYNKKVNNL